jgi:hypothetical protein
MIYLRLRDHMTNLEMVLNMLAAATTTEISKEKNPKTFDDSRVIAKPQPPIGIRGLQNCVCLELPLN